MPIAAGLYYFAHGADEVARPPVVLIHGAGGHYLYWPPQVRRLHGQRVFAVDLPGHGKSAGVGHHTIEDYSAVIMEFIKALKLNRAVLVGHSMGGAVALHAAHAFPKRVIGTALIGSAARLRVNAALLQMSADPSKAANAVHTIVDLSFAEDTSARLKELAAQRMLETRPSVLHGDLLACDSFDATAWANKIAAPTLLIFGKQDRMVSPRSGQALMDEIPGARLELVPDAGHMVMLEQPDRVGELLGDFLNSISYRPGR